MVRNGYMPPTHPCRRCGVVDWKRNGASWRCRPCQQRNVDAYRVKHAEKVKEAARVRENKKYHNDPRYRERVKKAVSRWQRANPERKKSQNTAYRDANRERVRSYRTEWGRQNRGRINEQQRARYRSHPEVARLASVRSKLRRLRLRSGKRPTLTKNEWTSILAVWEHSCAYCGTTNRPLQQDHVYPVSRGGPHAADNVVPACGPCNKSKSCRTPQEWREGLNARACSQRRTVGEALAEQSEVAVSRECIR